MLLAVSTAFAARMPENRGALTDDADVLGAQTAKDIAEYAEEAEDETGVSLHVVIVHFLDGLDVQTYADRLFASWRLGEDDMLLLGAAGEDSFASVLGEDVREKLGQKNAENLMYTSSMFGELFKRQEYDAAFGRYFVALNTLLNKQYDENIKLGDLFSSAQAPAQSAQSAQQPSHAQSAARYGSQLWQQVLGSIDENTADYQQYAQTRHNDDNGIGVGGWMVMAIIIMIIFGQSDPVRKARSKGRTHYRDYGCGCSPLGWILTMIGVNAIIDRLRGRR